MNWFTGLFKKKPYQYNPSKSLGDVVFNILRSYRELIELRTYFYSPIAEDCSWMQPRKGPSSEVKFKYSTARGGASELWWLVEKLVKGEIIFKEREKPYEKCHKRIKQLREIVDLSLCPPTVADVRGE